MPWHLQLQTDGGRRIIGQQSIRIIPSSAHTTIVGNSVIP